MTALEQYRQKLTEAAEAEKHKIFLENRLKKVKIKIHIILHNGLILWISDEAL